MDLYTVLVGIAAGLDPSMYYDSSPFLQVLLYELGCFAKRDARDEARIIVIACSFGKILPWYRQRVPRDTHRVLALCVSDVGFPGQPSEEQDRVKVERALFFGSLPVCHDLHGVDPGAAAVGIAPGPDTPGDQYGSSLFKILFCVLRLFPKHNASDIVCVPGTSVHRQGISGYGGRGIP